MNINKGDTIGIIALSGETDREKVESAKANLESWGYKVKLSKNIFSKNRYLAGSDEEKLEALKEMLSDNEIRMILASRGGYGLVRLVNKIDYDLIKFNPKVICGFSDFTILLLMIYKKTGMVTYHSPMAAVDFSEDVNEFTKNNFFDVVNGKINTYEGDKVYKNGLADGILWGGNLSTLVSLCGLDFIPNENFIFFTEDLNEPVYKIDKMFHQLMNIEMFRKYCKGIVLGDFSDVDNQEWLENLFCEIAKEMNIPVGSGFRITHEKEKITLPIGSKTKLEGRLLTV